MESLLLCLREKVAQQEHQGKRGLCKSLIFCWNNPILVKCWRPPRTLCWLDLVVWWNSWCKIHTAPFFMGIKEVLTSTNFLANLQILQVVVNNLAQKVTGHWCSFGQFQKKEFETIQKVSQCSSFGILLGEWIKVSISCLGRLVDGAIPNGRRGEGLAYLPTCSPIQLTRERENSFPGNAKKPTKIGSKIAFAHEVLAYIHLTPSFLLIVFCANSVLFQIIAEKYKLNTCSNQNKLYLFNLAAALLIPRNGCLTIVSWDMIINWVYLKFSASPLCWNALG